MSVASLALLACAAAGGLLLTVRGERSRSSYGAAALAALVGIAGLLAWAADGASDGIADGAAVASMLAAVLGGGPVAVAVLRAADPAVTGVAGGPQDPDVLRGGTWIGLLERAAIGAALLAGSAEGLVVVAAVKGLGRYAELRAPAAAERFIIGTLASALWAAACVGVALLFRR
ncbi:MAG: hypothetical protein ACLGI3_11700 [Actinomycetes bacterium]